MGSLEHIKALEAENARLREVLKYISDYRLRLGMVAKKILKEVENDKQMSRHFI